jgi:sulfide:quinone oxidoreductase
MPLNVIVAGGGPAALEAVLALGEAPVRLTLVCPDEEFVYGPISVAEPFAVTHTRRYPLAGLAELGVKVLRDAVVEVLPDVHQVRLASGASRPYDALVLATGAEAEPAIERALTFTGPKDVEKLHGLIQDLEGGYVKSVTFVAPEGCRWTLPLYELALQTAERVSDLCLDDVTLSLVTHEPHPLEIFGPTAGALLDELLAEAGIERVEEVPEGSRVVSLPRLVGRAPAGVPVDGEGFIRVDGLGQVAHSPDVYAVGDGAAHQIKQGGLATQQADVVAHLISGENVALPEYVLRALLLTGGDPIYLRRSLRADADAEVSRKPLWWPPSKIAGDRLTPFLDAQDEEPTLERRLSTQTARGFTRRAVVGR